MKITPQKLGFQNIRIEILIKMNLGKKQKMDNMVLNCRQKESTKKLLGTWLVWCIRSLSNWKIDLFFYGMMVFFFFLAQNYGMMLMITY